MLFILAILFFLHLLLVVAVYTYLERKVLASIQLREGPNRAGLWGLLQPIADALKLLGKELIFPRLSNIFLTFLSPVLLLFLALFLWLFMPLPTPTGQSASLVSSEGSLLFIFVGSGLAVYALFLAG
jgi:NADH-quinone oxidoreductase subunit H